MLIPDRVLDLYVADESLKPLGLVSYLGVPLYDTDRSILGHLAILHDQPMREDPLKLAIFDIFASRAASELRRVCRDRDLREREQKLTRLIESAMDAIIEIDADLKVTRVNQAAVKTIPARHRSSTLPANRRSCLATMKRPTPGSFCCTRSPHASPQRR